MNAIEKLFLNAVDPDSVRTDPISPGLTIPRTWGVYKIEDTNCGPSGKRYRTGNHPIRCSELQREFGKVSVGAVMPAKELAVELEANLNSHSSIRL